MRKKSRYMLYSDLARYCPNLSSNILGVTTPYSERVGDTHNYEQERGIKSSGKRKVLIVPVRD